MHSVRGRRIERKKEEENDSVLKSNVVTCFIPIADVCVCLRHEPHSLIITNRPAISPYHIILPHSHLATKTQPGKDILTRMAPKNNAKGGGDKKGKGAKDDDQGGKASGKGAAAGLKPATAINVRHILVRLDMSNNTHV